jgi:hypothetical protein
MRKKTTELYCDLCGVRYESYNSGANENRQDTVTSFGEAIYYGTSRIYEDFCEQCRDRLDKLLKEHFPDKKGVEVKF